MTHFDPSSDPACRALDSAYEETGAKLRQTHEPASAEKVAQLHKLMQDATPVSRASHGLGVSSKDERVRQAEYVTRKHDAFLDSLEPGQRTIFARMEAALKNGLSIPDTADIKIGTDEPSRKKEIEHLKKIIEHKWTGELSSQQKSARLGALLNLEWRLLQLLASQPENLSANEKAKTAELCSLYIETIADDFRDKIQSSTPLKKALEEFERATQFFTRFKGYSAHMGENVFLSSAKKSIEAFWQASDKLIGGSKLASQVKACRGDREAALAMHQTLKLRQQLLLAANRTDAALALNEPLKQLNDEFHFDEALLAKQVEELGVAFKPIAVPTSKTASVARKIIPYVGAALVISHQAMQLHNEGKSYPEIATTIGLGIATQVIARPLSNLVSEGARRLTPAVVKKHTPKVVKEGAQILVDVAVTVAVSQAASYSVKSFTHVPSHSVPQQGKVFPTTAFNVTRDALPVCPSVPAPMCDPIPPPLTSPIMYDVIPESITSAASNVTIPYPQSTPAAHPSLWETISLTASAAGTKLKEIGSQAAETTVGKVAIGAASVGASYVGFLAKKIARR